MPRPFNFGIVKESIEKLNHHPMYQALRSVADLCRFMECHVFSVWDFMSLVKYLQNQIAPTQIPWAPQSNGSLRRFINALVLEEESDESLPLESPNYSSHFELYCQAMQEIGADSKPIWRFVEIATHRGLEAAFESGLMPEPSRLFTQATFDFIATDKPHVIAAALAVGREHIIPGMFRAVLEKMAITPTQAPIFHYYLQRHIHLDEDFHAPLSLQLLNALCEGDDKKLKEAEDAAKQAILVRSLFWDKVLHLIKKSSKAH